jgi:hypothetical protein
LIMYLSPRRMLSSLACAPRAGCLRPGDGTAPAGGEAVGPMSGVVCMR